MSECSRFRDLFQKLLAGEASSSEEETLRRHADDCRACAELMELHQELMATAREVPEPEEGELRAMRQGILEEIAFRDGTRTWSEEGTPRGRVWGLLRGLHPAATLAAALLLAAAAFFFGRSMGRPCRFDDDLLKAEIERQASTEGGLAGYWDTPFVYSNVSVNPREEGMVELGFDVARHVELVTPENSPVTKQILIHAILDPSEVGPRLKAISLAEEAMDSRLKEVISFTLLNDPAPAVRLRAIQILGRYVADPKVQETLLRSLAQDQSVQIRLLALEYLAKQKVDEETLTRAIGGMSRKGDPAVLHRMAELTGAF